MHHNSITTVTSKIPHNVILPFAYSQTLQSFNVVAASLHRFLQSESIAQRASALELGSNGRICHRVITPILCPFHVACTKVRIICGGGGWLGFSGARPRGQSCIGGRSKWGIHPPAKHAAFLIGRYAHISETACGMNVSLSSLDTIPRIAE